MPCVSPCCFSLSANPHQASLYSLRFHHFLNLANPPVFEKPIFPGYQGQPIFIDNPVPSPLAELPAFINQAPPGLGSPVFFSSTLCPPNLESPFFDPENVDPFFDQLNSPSYHPLVPPPNKNICLLGDPESFVVDCAPIGNAWAVSPQLPTEPPHPDSPGNGSLFVLDQAPAFNLPPIPPAIDEYPFMDFIPVPLPEPRGFYDLAKFHHLNFRQIDSLL